MTRMNRLLKSPSVTAALAALSLAAAAVVTGAEHKPPGRTSDVVVLKGSEVPTLLGIPMERIGGYSIRNGRLVPAPFQIDERDTNGDLIYTTFEGGTTAGLDGRLDGKDDIVFMFKDAGPRRKGEALPPGAIGGVEVRVSDPLGGPEAWFYLLAFKGKAPRSDVDYVKYDPVKDRVTSIYYTIGFPYREAIQVPSYFSQSRAAGGSGENIYDLFKLRLVVDLKLFGKKTWSQNDFVTEPVGYVDGPVRVSRRIKSALRLAGPIHSAMIYSDSTYYPYNCAFPSLIQVPFQLSSIAHSVSMRISDDLSPAAKGMTWYNERNLRGIRISGKPSAEADALDRGDYRWKLASGPQGTLMSVAVFDPGLNALGKALYYVDDESKPDEPCQFRGQIGNSGYELSKIETLPKGNYLFTIYIFCPVDYEKGDEQAYLNSIIHPLTTSVSPLPRGVN